MQINSILKITEKFQTNSEFKVIVLISRHEVYNILHLWWHFLETATSWGGLATSEIYCNVLITELYQKSCLQFFDDFAVKVNKKCNLIKRRWWLHAHLTKKSVGLLYYTVQGNMVSTLWLISDLFSQEIWWNKSEVLIIKSKITDQWKAGQKVNSLSGIMSDLHDLTIQVVHCSKIIIIQIVLKSLNYKHFDVK